LFFVVVEGRCDQPTQRDAGAKPVAGEGATDPPLYGKNRVHHPSGGAGGELALSLTAGAPHRIYLSIHIYI